MTVNAIGLKCVWFERAKPPSKIDTLHLQTEKNDDILIRLEPMELELLHSVVEHRWRTHDDVAYGHN